MSYVSRILTYSDHDMQCPADWENGFKEARVMRFGDGERALSHMTTGDWQGASFSLLISDYDRTLRERLNSPTERYWFSDPWTVKMTDRKTRAEKGLPYTVFVGPLIDAKCTEKSGMAWDITLGDIVSKGLLTDEAQVPWRRIGDAFLSQLTQVVEGLDLDTPEPIIYGIHNRLPTDAPVPAGLVYHPTYLGIMTIGIDYHVWLVAGHACAGLPRWYVDGVPKQGDDGIEWFVPHWPSWAALGFPAPNYVDLRSDSFGTDRRYTLMFGKVTDPSFLDPNISPTGSPPDASAATDPDACARGDRSLTVEVHGVEPVGDGTGAVVTDRIAQYEHFLINFLAHHDLAGYQAGAWLENPTWSVYGADVPIVNADSFARATAISIERFPPEGYVGAAIIGAKSGSRRSVRDWIAAWNRSCGVRFGVNHLGQLIVFMLHPTLAVKAAAPLIEETNDILEGTFQPWVRWSDLANRIPFQYDYNHETSAWMGVNTYDEGISIEGYNHVIPCETRTYEFAPGHTCAFHIAIIEGRQTRYPPRGVTFETSVGPLTALDIGSYVRYRHYASISASAEEVRLGVIERHQVQAGRRRVSVDILDVEELIGFDANQPPVAVLNDRCATAIEIVLDVENHFSVTLETTPHTTDTSVEGAGVTPPLPGPGIAYHPAWFKFTAPGSPGNLALITTGSNYDTQLAILTGVCGAPPWTLEKYSDTMYGGVITAGETLTMLPGATAYFLVFGYGPDDAGTLLVTCSWAPELPPVEPEPPPTKRGHR